MIEPSLRQEPTPAATDRTVRQFAAMCLVVFGGFAARDVLVRGAVARGGVLGTIGLSLFAVGLARPSWVRPVFNAAIAATKPIGMVVSALILAIVYYVVFTPLALLFRLIGRDALRRHRRRPEVSSHWIEKLPPPGLDSYFRQS